MNNRFFRFLIILMSLSLIGVIVVQFSWVTKMVKNNETSFSLHSNQILTKVADDLDELEMQVYLHRYYFLKDSIGIDDRQQQETFLKFGYYQIDERTNETTIYSNTIVPDNSAINASFFDKSIDTFRVKSYVAKRKIEIFSEDKGVENNTFNTNPTADITISKSGRTDILDRAQYEMFFRDIAGIKPIEYRIKNEGLKDLLTKEFNEKGINIPFEYAVVSKKNVVTEIHSDNFLKDNKQSYKTPLFKDNEGKTDYVIEVYFPSKTRFMYSQITNTLILSVFLILIIIVVFVTTTNQFLKQREISQIKTDFINNMTHEFKTPIATINLALDSIKSPKIFEHQDILRRYHGIIRDENKRMNAQVENVLRISKLDKKELDIQKEPVDIHDLIRDAKDHVSLLIDEREGKLIVNNKAARSTVLANDTHFTNVLVNIIENAIKYSPESPRIQIVTENIKDLILIKIKDNGQGISKSAQKKIFDKFYREHTGDIHNVKGHGLGLAYVKRIVTAHGGEIFVESEKGIGSTFIIKLSLIIN